MAKRTRRPGSFGYIVSKGTSTHPNFSIRWKEGRTQKRKSGFRTRTEAAEALARVRTGLGDGTLVEKRRAGIGFVAVARQWLDLHSKPSLRSHVDNEERYRDHVAPFFGDCPLSAITPTRLLEFRARLQAKGLAPRTVNLVLALGRAMLRFAVANGHLASAPTDRLARGKLMLPIEKGKLAPPIAKPEEVGALLEEIRERFPHRFALFATLVYTGMRRGEACGLRWQDVNLDRRIITIRRSYDGQTKSGSHREVPIPGALLAILRTHRIAEPFQGEVVFPNNNGEMLSPNGKLQDLLRIALTAIGLARIRLHDLRHVHASHFLMAGGNIYDLQKNLGHHSVAFTAAVYGHLSADHRVRESDRLSFDAPELGRLLPFEAAAK